MNPASRILRWMRDHKWKSLLAIIVVYIGVELFTIPWLSIQDLRSTNPQRTALMEQRLAEADASGRTLKIKHRWVPLRSVPEHVLRAIVVAEDGTFYSHGGVDWFEIWQSVERNVHERRVVRGASTITQQLAKNLYLSTARTPMRKVKELIITKVLEYHLGKERILELYVNVIEWGDGIFGIGAASETYFGKDVSALSLDEGLRLAAVIPSPRRYRPDRDSRYVMRRKQLLLRRMEARQFVSTTTEESSSPETGSEETNDKNVGPPDPMWEEDGPDTTGDESNGLQGHRPPD